MRTVSVPLGDRTYSILIGPALIPKIAGYIDDRSFSKRCAVITDSNVGPLYGNAVCDALRSSGFDPVQIAVPAGEKSKSLVQVGKCFDALAAHRLERKSFVVAVGGGVVGDLAGFVAASYLRGVHFLQIPTSLLAQVDSSVGGKVGVNLAAGKNLVGAFHQPRLVLCDLSALRSLPDREFRAGLGEVIKYGIIYDAEFFAWLEENLSKVLDKEEGSLQTIVSRSCEIKAEVVSQDETESGLRAILNFGHTIGHAVEAVFKYGKYLHGEAISIGQVAASEISRELMGFPASEVGRVRRLFERAGLPTGIRLTGAQRKKLFNAMLLDKKVAAGELKFVLVDRIGHAGWGHSVSIDKIPPILDQLQ